MSKTIHLDAPNIGRLEKEYLIRAVDSGYVSTVGPFVKEFEEKFAGYLGVKKAVSTQSGTSAIHMSLYELGIGKGDEVIVPALTFVGAVNPVVYVGAKPVFADVDPDTWNIDPDDVKRKLTKKTKAIIAVHLYGNPCDMDRLLGIARKNGIYLVEDATESLGARYKNRYTGTMGDFGCFSFNGNKVITTGGGGMVVGADIKRLEHIKFLVNQARDETDGYYHSEIGFNSRMTNLEAAMGLAQMKRVEKFLEKKATFCGIYRRELHGIASVSFQEMYPGAVSSCWMSCAIFERIRDIGAFRDALRRRGVITRRTFAPIVDFPPYIGQRKGRFENSRRIHDKGICLPSSTLNSKEDIKRVCGIIKSTLSDMSLKGKEFYGKV